MRSALSRGAVCEQHKHGSVGPGAGNRPAARQLGFGAGARAARERVPDPELVEKAKRRTFTAEYKLRILKQAEACTRPGEIGALLRREGLYTSHLTAWRKQRDAGALAGLDRTRGRKPADPRDAENAALRRRAERAEAELEKARKVIEIQGNVSALLEQMLDTEGAERAQAHRAMITETVEQLAPIIGTRPACRAVGAAPATIYRRRRPPDPTTPSPRPAPARALSDPNAGRCSMCCAASGSSIARPSRCGRRCWMRAATWRRRARCTGSSPRPRPRPRPPQSAHALAVCEVRTGRRAAQRARGREAERASEVDLLLPVRDARRVQPLHHRLDRPAPRGRHVAKALIEQQQITPGPLTVHADRGGSLRPSRSRSYSPIWASRARIAGRTQLAITRFRVAVRDAQVPARVPRAV